MAKNQDFSVSKKFFKKTQLKKLRVFELI